MKSRQFWLLSASYFTLGVSSWSVVVHVVPYATDMGLPAVAAAGILTFYGIFNVIGRIGSGFIKEKVGNKLILVSGFIMVGISLLWLQFINDLLGFYACAALFGLGNGGPGMAFTTTVADLFGMRSHGAITAVANIGGLIGGAAGTVFMGMFYDIYGNYSIAFWASSAFILVGIILVTQLKIKPVSFEMTDGIAAIK